MSARVMYVMASDGDTYFSTVPRDIIDIIAGFLRWDGAPIGALSSEPLWIELYHGRGTYFAAIPRDIIDIIVGFLRWDDDPRCIVQPEPLNIAGRERIDYRMNLILYRKVNDGKPYIRDFITGKEWVARVGAAALLSGDEYYVYDHTLERSLAHFAYNVYTGAKRNIEERVNFVPGEHIYISDGFHYCDGIIYINRSREWNYFAGECYKNNPSLGPPKIHPSVAKRAGELLPEYEMLLQFRHTTDMCITNKSGMLVTRWGDNIPCNWAVEHPRGAIVQHEHRVIFVESVRPNRRIELFRLPNDVDILHLYGNILITIGPEGLGKIYLTS